MDYFSNDNSKQKSESYHTDDPFAIFTPRARYVPNGKSYTSFCHNDDRKDEDKCKNIDNLGQCRGHGMSKRAFLELYCGGELPIKLKII